MPHRRVCSHIKRPCERPKSAGVQGARRAVWLPQTSDARRRNTADFGRSLEFIFSQGLPRKGPLAASCSLRIHSVFASSHSLRSALYGATHGRFICEQTLGNHGCGVRSHARRGIDARGQIAALKCFRKYVETRQGNSGYRTLACTTKCRSGGP